MGLRYSNQPEKKYSDLDTYLSVICKPKIKQRLQHAPVLEGIVVAAKSAVYSLTAGVVATGIGIALVGEVLFTGGRAGCD